MTQTETAIMIGLGVMALFGGPFLLGLIEAITTNNIALQVQLYPIGFIIIGFCLLVLIIGVWLDGLH